MVRVLALIQKVSVLDFNDYKLYPSVKVVQRYLIQVGKIKGCQRRGLDSLFHMLYYNSNG